MPTLGRGAGLLLGAPRAGALRGVLRPGPLLAGLDLGGREDLVSTLSVLAYDPDSPATVLVSHHVEEIPPNCSHAMLMRGGRVVAQGLLDDVMTSENLSATFDQPLELTSRRRRFTAFRR